MTLFAIVNFYGILILAFTLWKSLFLKTKVKFMKKKLISFLILACLSLGTLAVIENANAATLKETIQESDEFKKVSNEVYNETDTTTATTPLQTIISKVINAVLGLLGVIFLVLIIYAGFLWMTAAGNDDQVTKAKNILTRSIIGVIIIVAAYAISYFVLSNIIQQ